MLPSSPTSDTRACLIEALGRFPSGRCPAFRRDQFLGSLLECLEGEDAFGEGNQDDQLPVDELFRDETATRVLLDACRQVGVAKTDSVGPRIIGLITAELLKARTSSDRPDELIVNSAVSLNENEFAGFRRYYERLLYEVDASSKFKRDVRRAGDEITEIVFEGRRQIGIVADYEADGTPIDLHLSHGTWAQVLHDCGLLTRSVSEQTRQMPQGKDRLGPTLTTTTVSVVYKPAVKKLYDLLKRTKAVRA